jgi:hypothetical protein
MDLLRFRIQKSLLIRGALQNKRSATNRELSPRQKILGQAKKKTATLQVAV